MNNRVEVIRVVSCMIEDIRYLRENSQTRLKGYSQQFLSDIRRNLDEFSEDLRQLINRQAAAKTGDPRPMVEKERQQP